MTTRRMFAKQAATAGAAVLARRAWSQAGASGGYTGAGSLKAHASARGLYAGTAVNMELLDRDAAYARTIAEQYNIVVAENAMKWALLRPAHAAFRFEEADRFMAFARAHGMAVRGHNLCWHEQLPGWFDATVNKANAQEYLTKHIATVAGRYRGKIRAWDVVNEAIDPKDGQPGGLRNTPWYKLLGPGYLDTAFRSARDADPQALLTYNDYGIEADTPDDTAKRAAVLALLQRFRKDGVPIDAVGIQSHLSAGSAAKIGQGLQEFVAQCGAMHLKVFVTELDVNDDDLATDDAKARAGQIAAIYAAYLSLLLENRAVTDVLTWGASNRYSWLNAKGTETTKFRPKHPDREEQCLPFNDEYQAEPAFFALRAALDARSISKIE